jgi:hypothetical protein
VCEGDSGAKLWCQRGGRAKAFDVARQQKHRERGDLGAAGGKAGGGVGAQSLRAAGGSVRFWAWAGEGSPTAPRSSSASARALHALDKASASGQGPSIAAMNFPDALASWARVGMPGAGRIQGSARAASGL